MPVISELEKLSRQELIERALRFGVARPELMTRVELTDEIVRRSETDPTERKRARGWLGIARDLLASVVEQGLHLPDAAALIRGDVSLELGARAPAPVATVTLSEIYAAQGHIDRAVRMLDQVLEKEPDHDPARALRDKLIAERDRRAATKAAARAREVARAPETARTVVEEPEPPEKSEHDEALEPASLGSELEPEKADARAGAEARAQADAGAEARAGAEAQADADAVWAEPMAAEPQPAEAAVPEPTAVVEPITLVEPEPAAVVEREPVASAEPVAVVESEPAAAQPEPALVEPEPAVVEPEPAAIVEPEPPVVAALEAPVEPEPATTPTALLDRAGPKHDSVVVMRSAGRIRVYWELRPETRRRAERRWPDGRAVVRVVGWRPSWDGAQRVEHDLEISKAQDCATIDALGEVAEVRAALGWSAAGELHPFSLATELAAGATVTDVRLQWIPPAQRAMGEDPSTIAARAVEHWSSSDTG